MKRTASLPVSSMDWGAPALLLAEVEVEEVPSVDFALIGAAHEDEMRKLVDAAKDWGILQISNHGVSPQLIADMEEQLCDAFALPIEVKTRAQPLARGSHGFRSKPYSQNDGKSPLNESFRLPVNALHREDIIHKLWPQGNERFSSVTGVYIAALESILVQLLRSLATGLGLHPLQFTRDLSHEGNSSVFRMNFYEPSPQRTLPTLDFPAHSDPQILTILHHNGVGGLQILKDDKWIGVLSQPGAFLVNIGDTLQVISNDVYRSVIHRVVMKSEKLRVSMALALAPDPQVRVETVVELVTEQRPSKYRPFTPEEYFEVLTSYGLNDKKAQLDKFIRALAELEQA